MRDADGAEPEIGVAQHHALGAAGGAGGVEQGGEAVGIGGGRPERDLRLSSSGRPLLLEDDVTIAVARLQRRQPRLAA